MLELALKESALSPREVAARFVDQRRYFVSEASVYRLLKARGLITSPAFILLQAAARFAQPTTAPNQLWQTDFTYLRVVGWGGSICPPCWTISRAISWPGNCARA